MTELLTIDPPVVAATFAGDLLTEVAANPRRDAWRLFRRNKAAMVGLGWAVLLTFVAAFAKVIERYDPKKIDVVSSLQGPSRKHWLGADLLGRDVWSRIVNGSRVSLSLALGVVTVALVLSLFIGALAGFRGGWFDATFMRFADIVLALPYIIVVLAFTSVFGRSIWILILAIVSISWMGTARLFRGSVLQVRSLDYIEAARASGASTTRILRRHVFSNAIQPVIVSIGFSIGAAILLESVFSFLGIGLEPGTPSWGVMVGDSRQYITSSSHLFFFPAGALVMTVLAFSFIGDGVRDALDPKLRGF
jgi:ABC-type dipeptide/oligopeptide/nickel transport system permease subunit